MDYTERLVVHILNLLYDIIVTPFDKDLRSCEKSMYIQHY